MLLRLMHKSMRSHETKENEMKRARGPPYRDIALRTRTEKVVIGLVKAAYET